MGELERLRANLTVTIPRPKGKKPKTKAMHVILFDSGLLKIYESRKSDIRKPIRVVNVMDNPVTPSSDSSTGFVLNGDPEKSGIDAETWTLTTASEMEKQQWMSEFNHLCNIRAEANSYANPLRVPQTLAENAADPSPSYIPQHLVPQGVPAHAGPQVPMGAMYHGAPGPYPPGAVMPQHPGMYGPPMMGGPGSAQPPQQPGPVSAREQSLLDFLRPFLTGPMASNKFEGLLKADKVDMLNAQELHLAKRIGRGGFGEVYLGNYHGTDVAVKRVLSCNLQNLGDEEELVKMQDFIAELAIMSTLRHPNIVFFMGASFSNESLCLVTEFCSKGSVYQLLRTHPSEFTASRIVDVCKQVVKGMMYVHHYEPPILHRDLKSANLLVDASWNIKIADFGLSRVKSADQQQYTRQVGTPQWMAPEVLKGIPYSEKADVYSFGVCIWEMVMRDYPFRDMEPMAIMLQVVNDNLKPPPPPESACPQALTDVIYQCLATEADERPSFDELKTIFDKLRL